MVLPENGLQAQPLHETLANVLVLCNQWRSLDEHTEVAIKEMPALQPHAQQVRQGLTHMVEQGFLVDAKQLSQRYAEPASSKEDPKGIKTLYVRTYCCPNALERLLQSIQSGRSGASVKTLVVIDDARNDSDVERSQTLLASYRKKLKINLVHVTRADRDQLADALAAASGADAQDLRWWLNGDPDDPEMTAGATFNTALLLSAGTATAIMDDDAQLTPYGDPQESSEMGSVSMGGDLKEEALWHMHASSEDLESNWSPLDIDPVADHSRWLGMSLSKLVAKTSSPENFWQPIKSADLRALQPQAKVKVSINGILGDPGTGQASWLYTQPAECLTPWLQSEETYQQLVSQRLMARKPQGHQILPHHTLLTPLVGLDNRELMPPTLPNGRGEDTLFAELACGVYPDCLFAQIPWMLKHVPEKERQFDRDKLLRPVAMDANLFLTDYLHALRHAVPSAKPATRLHWLGQSLQALAEAPEGTLARDCRRNLTRDRSNMAQQLIRNLQTLQPPEYLSKDMTTLLTRCQQGLDSDTEVLNSALATARQRAQRYSQALNSWQSAWEYCRQTGESQLLDMTNKTPEGNDRNPLLSFLRLRKHRG